MSKIKVVYNLCYEGFSSLSKEAVISKDFEHPCIEIWTENSGGVRHSPKAKNEDLEFIKLAANVRPAISKMLEDNERMRGELQRAAANFDFLLRAIQENDPKPQLELRCKDGARYAIQALKEVGE